MGNSDDEKEIRSRLAENLGVEFYEPEDPEVNVDVGDVIQTGQRRARVLSHIRKMSVTDLIHQCNDAVSKMSAENPYKTLLWNCAFALRQLVERLEEKVN